MSAKPAQTAAAGLAELAPFFTAFGTVTRAAIIEFLMAGEKCVCEISGHLAMSQPLISHHLAVLRAAGFVRSRGEGARTYYSVDWRQFDETMRAFTDAVAGLREQDSGPSCACG